MKKIAVVIASIFVLAACSTAPATTSTVTVTATPTQSAAPAKTVDQIVIETARSENNSYINSLSDAEILDLTSKVCPVLDSGMSVRDMVTRLYSDLSVNGATDEQLRGVGIILGIGIAAYCPQYNDEVQSL